VPQNTGYQDNEFIRQQGLSKAAIYNSDESVIFPTTDGLIKLDKNMRVLWKLDSIKYVGSLSKLGNNLLIIDTDFKDENQKDNASTVTARLIDIGSGTLISKKILYDNNSPYSIDQNVCMDASNNFKYLLIRKSALAVNTEKPEVFSKLFSTTTEMLLLKLDNQCNVIEQKSIETKLTGENVNYTGCINNNKGDLFLFGYSTNKIFCEKINSGELKSSASLETNIDIGKYGINSTIITLNTESNNEADIVLKYKNIEKDFVVTTAKFDFDKHIGQSDELSLDKKLVKSIGPGFTYRFELVGLVHHKDKIFMLLEFESGDGSKIYTGPIIVRVLDENMGLVNMLTLDKDYERYSPICPVAGYKILNDRLILLANTNKGMASLFPWYTEINLNTLEIKKPISIAKKYVDDGLAIEGPATLWFNNMAILQYYTGVMRSHKIVMQKVEF
jgi:hypothetical protein